MIEITLKAARLYEMRDFARSILGDRYDEEVGKAQRVLERKMELDGCSSLSAAIRLARPASGEQAPTLVVAVLFAAVIEMAEAEGPR